MSAARPEGDDRSRSENVRRRPSGKRRQRAPVSAYGSLRGLLASKEIVICCGPGGVGKTTIAASIAVMAAIRQDGKVLVLTIDPARRLADALGLSAGIGSAERKVPQEAFSPATGKPRGELWASMLDTKESWDALVRRHAPNQRIAGQILSNKLYQSIAGQFVQSHDYIAMEKLFEIHAEGKYDLIVVDTPPSRHALDFLDAPKRMEDFFSSRLLRWLTVPYRSRLAVVASRPFYQVADKILGTQFLGDIVELFTLFQSMHSGFVERARTVNALLHDGRTTFVVASTLESVPLREAQFFASLLEDRGFDLGAVVLNKTLPHYLRSPAAARAAELISANPAGLARELSGCTRAGSAEPSKEMLCRVIEEVAGSFRNFQVLAEREMAQEASMTTAAKVVATAPSLDADVCNIEELAALGQHILA